MQALNFDNAASSFLRTASEAQDGAARKVVVNLESGQCKEVKRKDTLEMKSNNSAIAIENLAVRYDGQWVFRSFGLHINRGDKVTLTGPSGSGKSTVLKCVLGLVVPSEGSISILGQEVTTHGVWAARLQLAYVAQEPDLGSGTARQAIGRPFTYKANIALRKNLESLPALLDRFNLPQSLLDKATSSLSGGEKQRFALVSAILLDRPIILLDEASSALDKANKQAVEEYFQQASDLTVLSVSHDAEWSVFSNRVVDMLGTDRDKGAQA